MTRHMLYIAASFILALSTSAYAADTLSIDTGAMSVTMAAKDAWTISSLKFNGTQLIIPKGGQGAVLSVGNDWFGSNMAGGETVASFAVSADGTPIPDAPLMVATGDKIITAKKSTLYKFAHASETTFKGDMFIQKHSFTAREDMDLSSFYAFIYSATPSTTAWAAESLSGQPCAGTFANEKGNAVNANVKWVVQFDASSGNGLLFYYITQLNGSSAYTRVWDMPGYHKFFVQPFSGSIKKDASFEYSMIVKCFSAGADWQAVAAAEAAKLAAAFPPTQKTATAPRLYDEGVPEDGRITLKSAGYTIPFSAKQAWTIESFTCGETEFGKATGFYGTVLIPRDGQWIGTGHTEGGREIVHAINLTVDGRPTPIEIGRTYEGSRLTLVKDSTIHTFHATTTITITDDEVIERQQLEATADTDLKLMYLFMHCWVNTTTHWSAELADGSFEQGQFISDGKQLLNKETRWVAEYEPSHGVAVIGYTPRILTGNGSFTHLWDHERYHKFYTRRVGGDGEQFPAGTKLDYTMIIKTVPNEDGSWQATKAAAATLKAKFPPVE